MLTKSQKFIQLSVNRAIAPYIHQMAAVGDPETKKDEKTTL